MFPMFVKLKWQFRTHFVKDCMGYMSHIEQEKLRNQESLKLYGIIQTLRTAFHLNVFFGFLARGKLEASFFSFFPQVGYGS